MGHVGRTLGVAAPTLLPAELPRARRETSAIPRGAEVPSQTQSTAAWQKS